ncbi:MAG TPA: helix-hairpin-helix domain-containing protein, partial [Saprospiraceae bacterium]|nr:helix-hairpin-helix domain-containing protein [Saprospiraceae bacterium]
NLDVIIMEIDTDSRKLSLGHKQLEENPWDTFEKVFPVGSYHEATVLRKDDRGYTVQLPYGLEAYAPVKHMKKEDNTQAAVEEVLTVKVIEFNRDDKKIMVSHSKYLDDIKREADDNVRKERVDEVQKVKKAVEKQQSKVEATTLGEIEGFSALKQQFQDKAGAPVIPAPEKPAEVLAEAPKADLFSAEEAPAPKKEAKADDLKIIEGIGPKIAELLHADGIVSFKDLSEASLDKLKDILEKAGSRYKMHDPTTWPQQAGLAAEGRMDELKQLQDTLKAGKSE